MEPDRAYSYRRDLALVHHLGFGAYADACAPGVLALLDGVRRRDGLVLELGCGSGRLTRHLVDAGHRVVATDASPAMLDLARAAVPGAEAVESLVLPDDPLPPADAVVSVGHALSYLPDAAAVQRGLVAIAAALRPAGVLVVDLCDYRWGAARRATPVSARVEEGWAVVVCSSVPAPDRVVRDITTFVRGPDGSWRRDDERHEHALVRADEVPALLAGCGVTATVESALGAFALPEGLVAVIGRRQG